MQVFRPTDLTPRMRFMLATQKFRDFLKRRNTFGDRIIMEDQVLVWEGSREQVAAGKAKLKFISKGHIVNQGLISIVNALSAQALSNAFSYNFNNVSDTKSYMRLGTGGSVTTGATTALTTIVSTEASSRAGTNSNPSGSYRVAWTATWNAGVLSAITVTELGLFLDIGTSLYTLQTFQTTQSTQSVTALFSRLSEADGDFTGFLVNTAVPLTIEWRLTLTFA